jgi:hypothetical protein
MITKIAFPVFSQLTTYETTLSSSCSVRQALPAPKATDRVAAWPRGLPGHRRSPKWLSANLHVWTVAQLGALLSAEKAVPAVCPLSKVSN